LATGTVTFTINGGNAGVVPLNNGEAVFMAAFPNAGSQTIMASYSGDTNNPPGSNTLTQIVNPQTTATTLTSSLNPSVVNEPVTYIATH